jgi:hypothetical protein
MTARILAGLALLGLLGCSSSASQGEVKTIVVRDAVNELEKEPVPGTQSDVWVEPMYDSIRVPGAIDPKGIYYRRGHNELVEIRPGKFQKVEYPDYNGKYRQPR